MHHLAVLPVVRVRRVISRLGERIHRRNTWKDIHEAPVHDEACADGVHVQKANLNVPAMRDAGSIGRGGEYNTGTQRSDRSRFSRCEGAYTRAASCTNHTQPLCFDRNRCGKGGGS